MRIGGSRSGLTTGDAILGVSCAALLASVAFPFAERAAMHRQAERVGNDVVVLIEAADRHRTEVGDWPQGANTGVTPNGLVPYLPEDFSPAGQGYVLRWDRWTLVALPPAEEIGPEFPESDFYEATPPQPDSTDAPYPVLTQVGGVTVRSDDGRVLSRLQERFGADRSFMREGSWTLVLTESSRAP